MLRSVAATCASREPPQQKMEGPHGRSLSADDHRSEAPVSGSRSRGACRPRRGAATLWRRATLGDAARDGDPITVWCNNRACSYWLEHGRQYRATLTPGDLAAYAD